MLGARLELARRKAGASQEEAAEAADVDPIAVESWESGRAMPSLIQFRQLVSHYGVLPGMVLFGGIPVQITRSEATEMRIAVEGCSSSVRAKVDCVLAMFAEPSEDLSPSRS